MEIDLAINDLVEAKALASTWGTREGWLIDLLTPVCYMLSNFPITASAISNGLNSRKSAGRGSH